MAKVPDPDLVTKIYDVATSPADWAELLDILPPIVNSKGAIIAVSERSVSTGELVTQFGLAGSIFDKEKIAVYNRDHIQNEVAFVERVVSSEAGSLVVDPAFDDRKTIVDRPDVAFAIENFDVLDRFAIKLNDDLAWSDILAFQYPSSRGNVTAEEFANLKPLIPSLAQSVVQMRMFESIRKRYSAVFSVLNRIDVALLILDKAGQVILRNDCASQLIDDSSHLSLGRGGVLAARESSTQQVLKQAVNNAASTAQGMALTARTLITVGSDLSPDNLLLEVTPLSDSSAEIDTGFRGAMVLVIDPNRAMPIPLDALKLFYGLTNTEAEVAALLSEGHSYDTLAESRNVGRETVKSQVSALYRKLKTDSRAGLVRRVLSVSLPFKQND